MDSKVNSTIIRANNKHYLLLFLSDHFWEEKMVKSSNKLFVITTLLFSLPNIVFANPNTVTPENTNNYLEAESIQTKLVELLEVDPMLKMEKIKLTPAASDFLLRNKEELLERMTAYKKLFKYNRHWFLYSKPELAEFSKQNVDLDLMFIFAFQCKNCIRMGDLLRNYRQYGSLKKQPVKIHLNLIPFGFKDPEKNIYFYTNAIVQLSLKSIVKNEDDLLEINNRMVFDATYNKLDTYNIFNIISWLKKNNINAYPMLENIANQSIPRKAIEISDLLDKLEMRTVPMVIINNKFVLLKNIVDTKHSETYNDDLSRAILDYVATLALLEKNNIIFFKSEKNKISISKKLLE